MTLRSESGPSPSPPAEAAAWRVTSWGVPLARVLLWGGLIAMILAALPACRSAFAKTVSLLRQGTDVPQEPGGLP